MIQLFDSTVHCKYFSLYLAVIFLRCCEWSAEEYDWSFSVIWHFVCHDHDAPQACGTLWILLAELCHSWTLRGPTVTLDLSTVCSVSLTGFEVFLCEFSCWNNRLLSFETWAQVSITALNVFRWFVIWLTMLSGPNLQKVGLIQSDGTIGPLAPAYFYRSSETMNPEIAIHCGMFANCGENLYKLCH